VLWKTVRMHHLCHDVESACPKVVYCELTSLTSRRSNPVSIAVRGKLVARTAKGFLLKREATLEARLRPASRKLCKRIHQSSVHDEG
jgi:hypothetical protein